MTDGSEWRHCSTCKKSIGFEQRYYRCSVSTCNRQRMALFFCSVECWDAHVPLLRHRDAWAEEARAPSREAAEFDKPTVGDEREATEVIAAAPPTRRVVTPASEDDLDHEVLVVVSKLKQYVRTRSGMNTSDSVVAVLSNHLRRLCDAAIDNASREGRRTVLDRDVLPLVRP